MRTMFAWREGLLRVGTKWEDPNGAGFAMTLEDYCALSVRMLQIASVEFEELPQAPAYTCLDNCWAYTVDTFERAGVYKLAFTSSLYIAMARDCDAIVIYVATLYDNGYFEYRFNSVRATDIKRCAETMLYAVNKNKPIEDMIADNGRQHRSLLRRNVAQLVPVDKAEAIINAAPENIRSAKLTTTAKVYFAGITTGALKPLWFDDGKSYVFEQKAGKPYGFTQAQRDEAKEALIDVLTELNKETEDKKAKERARWDSYKEKTHTAAKEIVNTLAKEEAKVKAHNATKELVNTLSKEQYKAKAYKAVEELVATLDALTDNTNNETDSDLPQDLQD